MNIPSLTDPEFEELLRLVTALRQGVLAASDIRLPRTPAAEKETNQALLFVKPEALARKVDIPSLITLVMNHIREADLSLGGVTLLGWKLMASGLIADHYSVINRISRFGESVLTATARAAVSALTEDGQLEVLGAHQFIERTDLTALELQRLAGAAGIDKVAQGTYVTVVREPLPSVVLNVFHPAQLEHFTAPGAVVLALDVGFTYPWPEFRDQVLGVTDPAEALAGSLRRKLLEAHIELGLAEVSRNRNCVHGSGGPIEAMAEISRFFRLALANTQFGASAVAAGIGQNQLTWAASNPLLEDGSSLFEITECMSPQKALDILSALPPGANG